ncbi:unnamed protein product [Gemmata massiliana]|uniref:Uncharacterized protein n=1 Tax=Gemmata massiliana TaxID=1210884 RepID=A0A6P2CUC4_9BACT|nr:hypothetical protein [Gemmata massiliana]VTR92513.1 unnamed protein product [Gemmata massiliana]
MRLDGRVKKLAKQMRVDQRLPSWLEESIVAHQERHERFLARIPTDLRSAIEEQLRHPRWSGTLWAWESTPFAKWAPEPRPGYLRGRWSSSG